MASNLNIDFGPPGEKPEPKYIKSLNWMPWAAGIFCFAFVAGLIALNGANEKIRRESEAATEATIKLRKDLADGGAVTGEYVEKLLAKAETLFRDPGEIMLTARDARDRVREFGQEADTIAIVEGGVYLAEHTHYPEERGKMPKPGFSEYCTYYVDWRKQGMTHKEAIAKIDELEKF